MNQSGLITKAVKARIPSHVEVVCMYMLLMTDAEGRKKEASKVIQTRQGNTAHPWQLLFQRKNELLTSV